MRRQRFLLGAVSGLTVAANVGTVWGKAFAQASLPHFEGNADDRVLVVVNMKGGNDGLNTVVPFASREYYQYRPTLGIAAGDALHLNDSIGFNPAMASLKRLYDNGNVAVVLGAGYPRPDHSHFRSTEIWQTAAPDRYDHTGWLGRLLDESKLPKDNLFNAVAVAQVLPEAMIAEHTDVPAIANLSGYSLASDKTAPAREAFHAVTSDSRMPFNSPYLGYVAEIEDHAQRGSEELPRLIAGYKSDASYPATALGRSLALAAQIVGSKLGTRVIYVEQSSYDTHAAQKGTQDRLLRELSDSLVAFYDDLAKHGNDKRVLTMTFSEFGRRVAENASRGTDHGEAAPMFLVGGGVKGGIYGKYPSLTALDNGDLIYTTDFRSVYATVVENWFGRPSSTILAGSFPKLTLV
jgi:uncharacterized protein (DUF1501 family)